MEWQTWLTDKLRQLMFPALVLSIVASLYLLGYADEREYDVEHGLATAPLPQLQIRFQPDADENAAATLGVHAGGAATRPVAPSASAAVPVSD